MRQAVVAQVIAERTFGQLPVGIEIAADAEIGLGVDRQAAGAADHRHAPPPEHAGEGQFAHALGQRHHGGDGHGRRAADEDVDPQPLAAPDRRRVMGADAAMDLVVQPDLARSARTARRKAARGTCPGSLASKPGRSGSSV